METVIEVGRASLRDKIFRMIWYIVRFILFRPFGTKLFNPWRIFLLKLFGAHVEWNSGVYSSVNILAPWNLYMGHNAWLGPGVICYNVAAVVIENDVTVSQYAYLCSAGHKTDELNNTGDTRMIAPIRLKKGTWVGTDAFIGMGVTIGEGAIVGARAAVFKDVEPWTIVGGNPAKFLKRRVMREQSAEATKSTEPSGQDCGS